AKPYEMDVVRNIVQEALASRRSALPAASRSALSEDATRCMREAQERLNAMVSFTRRLFAEREDRGIARCASNAAREILLAQCAEVFVGRGRAGESSVASGLGEGELKQLLASQMYRDLHAVVAEEGGSAMFPMSPAESQLE